MRILGELPVCRSAGPMPRWQRWLCVILLVAMSPLLLAGLLAFAVVLLLETGASVFQTPTQH